MGQKSSTFKFDDEKKQDLISELLDTSKGKFKWRVENKYDFIEANSSNNPLFWRRYILPIGDEIVRGSPLILDLNNPIDKAINYYYGITRAKNIEKAKVLFKKLLNKGNKVQKGFAYYYLGKMYINGEYKYVNLSGDTVKKRNIGKGHMYYKKSSEYKNPLGISAHILHEYEEDLPKKEKTILLHLGENGYSIALMVLGTLSEFDKISVEKAARLGNSVAMNLISHLVGSNNELLLRSASLGDLSSMRELIELNIPPKKKIELAIYVASLDGKIDKIGQLQEMYARGRLLVKDTTIAMLLREGRLNLFLEYIKKGILDKLRVQELHYKLKYCNDLKSAQSRYM